MAYKLITTFYRSDREDRQTEIDGALLLNLSAFDAVHVLAEHALVPSWFRGEWEYCYARPTFAAALATAGAADSSDIVVLANSDIFIPRATLDVVNANLAPGEVYCLSRWDLFADERGADLFDRDDSQDAWVFRGPPRPEIGGNFHFGMPGCDNRFAHELAAAGYRVLNPARDVVTYHVHLSGYRVSNLAENRVPQPYLFVKPAKLSAGSVYRRPKGEIKGPGAFRT